MDKEIGINTQFVCNPYRCMDLKTQKNLVKSLYKLNLKEQKSNRKGKSFPKVLASSDEITHNTSKSTKRYSKKLRPIANLESVGKNDLNCTFFKGMCLTRDTFSRSFSKPSCRKAKDYRTSSSADKPISKTSAQKPTEAGSKMNSIIRIGNKRKPDQIFKVFDDFRYPPTEIQKAAFKKKIKKNVKNLVYSQALETLIKQAYYADFGSRSRVKKSSGHIPKGKNCRIDQIISQLSK